MSRVLDVLACGAVTPVGLDAFQTAAAVRAKIAGFENRLPQTPPENPLRTARVPARDGLRRTPKDWLVNLTVRACREALSYRESRGRVGLVMVLPEKMRNHQAFAGQSREAFLQAVTQSIEPRVAYSEIAPDGGAGIADALRIAGDLLWRGDVDSCLVGGVDSLINPQDVQRLRATSRMLEPDNPQGLIPSEGAAFLLVSLTNRSGRAMAQVVGTGTALEQDNVLGPRFSRGLAFETALQAAISSASTPESNISLRVSTVNGEHYAVWESMFFATRFYRTRRERLPLWYTAASVGELGAASGAAAVMLAAMGIGGGYAPGPFAMCESASETGLRGACLIGPAEGAPLPPFRPEEGASRHLRRSLRRH
jgi:3-oxoacyl-[acyl-carrier-protein] synthase-1